MLVNSELGISAHDQGSKHSSMQEERAHELKDSRETDGFWGKQNHICGKGVAPDRHVPMDGPKPTSSRATDWIW